MANWLYKLKIKKLFMTDDPIPLGKLPEMAREVSERVKALSKRVEKRDENLSSDLEVVASLFEDISEYDPPAAEQDRHFFEDDFNRAMAELYDVADMGQVWVE